MKNRICPAYLLVTVITVASTACRSTDTMTVRGFEQQFDDGTLNMDEFWRLEGTGAATIENGRLVLQEDPDGVGVVLWTQSDWPENVELSFDLSFSNKRGIGVFFFAAQGAQGEDLFDTPTTRTGVYDEYIHGELNAYSFSLHRFFPDGKHNPGANLRRNPGFNLLNAASPDPVTEADRDYHIRLRKVGGSIQLEVDGATIHDYVDEDPLGAGKIGFRLRGHHSCRMAIDNVRIVALPKR